MNISQKDLRRRDHSVDKDGSKNILGIRSKLPSRLTAALGNMSLAQRTLSLSAVILIAFLSTSAVMLYTVFSISLESIVQEKLELHTYQLLSVGDSAQEKLALPVRLNEARFNNPQGSLIAFVKELTQDNQQNEIWRSISATDKQFSFPAPDSGQWFFGRAQGASGAQFYVSSFNTTWTNQAGVKAQYIFTVMEDFSYYQNQLTKYRMAIAIGLLSFGAVFLLLQTIILRIGLSPVRRITADVEAMNKGETHSLEGQYTKEFKPLAANLNRLIENERHQRERYRERMADLSHGLKTPLSVLRGVESDIDDQGQPLSRESVLDTLGKQVSRMTKLVDHQLQRSVSGGAPTVSAQIDVADKANEIISALNKVYAAKAVTIALKVDTGISFYGDENDFIEVIGNLLDNAYKNAKRRVLFSASRIDVKNSEPRLAIVIEDDGVGVPIAKRSNILKRGVRLDSSADGQGFGLSIVAGIVNSYQGSLRIEDSTLGGALFEIIIPTR